MIYLLLSIFCSSWILWTFKWFEKFGVNTFPAIVVNYFVCVLTAYLTKGSGPLFIGLSSWAVFAGMLGVLFITGFYLMAYTTQKAGITSAAVAGKLSMILPLMVAFLVYGDTLSTVKVLGLLIALPAVVLASMKSSSDLKRMLQDFKWPMLLLLMSGVIEIILNFVQRNHLTDAQFPGFLSAAFGFAGILGVAAVLVNRKFVFTSKEFIAGLLLGIPNYGSLYFFLRALENSGFEASQVFPLTNLGVIGLTAVGAMLIFKEQLNRFNLFGLFLAFAAILLISWF